MFTTINLKTLSQEAIKTATNTGSFPSVVEIHGHNYMVADFLSADAINALKSLVDMRA